MRSWLSGVIAVLALVAIARATDRRVVASTTHFRIESAIDKVEVGDLPLLLEAQNAALTREFEAGAPPGRVMVLHASNADMIKAVVDSSPLSSGLGKALGLVFLTATRADTQGLFYEDTGVAHVVWRRGPDQFSCECALHEAVHQFMDFAGLKKSRTRSGAYHEGMAERWSNYRIDGQVIEFGPAVAPRVESIVQAYNDAQVRNFDLGAIAAQKKGCPPSLGWAFVTFLSEAEPQAFDAWARDVTTPDDLRASWARHFSGRADLNERFRYWLTQLYEPQPFCFVSGRWGFASDRNLSATVQIPLVFEAALKRPIRAVRIVSNVSTTGGAVGAMTDYADDLNNTRVRIRPYVGNTVPPEIRVEQRQAGVAKRLGHLQPVRVTNVDDVRIEFVPEQDGHLRVMIDGQMLTTLPRPLRNTFGVMAADAHAEFSVEYADDATSASGLPGVHQ